MTSVSSSSPISSIASRTRPTFQSAFSRKPAKTSIWRASSGRCASGTESHAGNASLRGVSSASAGITPELLLTLEGLLAIGVPAVVEAALVAGAPLRRDVVGRMRAARRVVRKPRLVRVLRAYTVQPLDRLVGHRIGQVEAFVRRWPEGRLVLGDPRVILA